MNRRDVIRLGVPLLSQPLRLGGAPCQSDLEPRTAAEYDAYLKQARVEAEQSPSSKPLARVPEDQRTKAMEVLQSGRPYVWNLHEQQPVGAKPVFKGVIVDWMGAVLLRGMTLETFERVLSQYDSYKKWYKPYIFDCYARPVPGPGVKNFLVTSILHDVYEKPAPLVPDQHFSFEVVAESNYFRPENGGLRALLIRTHATSIREAESGHPEHADIRSKNDLLPAGRGQGVLWRSDIWWHAVQTDSGLYAEYESLTLARSLEGVDFFSLCSALRLPGLKGKALQSIRERPRQAVSSVMLNTKAACEGVAG